MHGSPPHIELTLTLAAAILSPLVSSDGTKMIRSDQKPSPSTDTAPSTAPTALPGSYTNPAGVPLAAKPPRLRRANQGRNPRLRRGGVSNAQRQRQRGRSECDCDCVTATPLLECNCLRRHLPCPEMSSVGKLQVADVSDIFPTPHHVALVDTLVVGQVLSCSSRNSSGERFGRLRSADGSAGPPRKEQ